MPDSLKKKDLAFTGERLIPGKTDFALLEQHVARYRFALDYAKGARVLDAACGAGYGCFILSTAACDVTGMDKSSEAIEYARMNFSSPKIRYEIADILSMPFKSGEFDLAVVFEIFEHVQDARTFLGELKRVVKKNGEILISTPNSDYPKSTVENPFHVREYNLDEFRLAVADVFTGDFQILGQASRSAMKGFLKSYIRIKRILGIGPLMKKKSSDFSSPEQLLTMKLSSVFSPGNLKDAEFLVAIINNPSQDS